MYSLYFLGFVSFVLSLLLTPLVRNLFRRIGIMDQPDELRKLHWSAIPRVGGIAIAVSYVLSFAILLASNLKGRVILHAGLPYARHLLPALGLIFALGLLDDLMGLRPWQKLIGQAAAAGLAYEAGVRVYGFKGYDLGMMWSILLTILWLVACTNAVNLIDGVDGLAAGVGLFAAATSLLAGLQQNNVALAYATVPLVGCLLGFLRYNFNPATIFLGDCGSLFIGFLLGCYGVLWSQKSATILGMTAPLMALSIPLLDTALAIVRRFARRQPIFTGDRGHIHHRLLDRGLTPRRVALIIYALCGFSGMASMALSYHNFSGIVIIVFCAATWIGVQHLGYVEFGVAGRMFMEGAFRRLLHSQITLQALEQELVARTTIDEWLVVVRRNYREFGFHSMRVRLAGHAWIDCDDENAATAWELRLPISEYEYINFRYGAGSPDKHTIVVLFIDVLRRTLESKVRRISEMEHYRVSVGAD